MSVNYATGLSPYEHKGKCGMPEICDSQSDLEEKSARLAQMIRESQHMVVITGAGISTAVGIPDFRGPTGVWTLEQKGKEPQGSITFDHAVPSVTHLALVALESAGYLKFLISQNVDGLHLRSGYPRSRLAELHGNMFVEECDVCKAQYIRQKSVPTMARRPTGGICTQSKHRGKCRGHLRDTILDWEDELPKKELNDSDEHCRKSDLCLCLGTSLQILPCGNMPLLTKKNNGRIVIINLQTTRLDKQCNLRIHGYVDSILTAVCKQLDLSLPKWERPLIVLQSLHTRSSGRGVKIVVDEELLTGKESSGSGNKHENLDKRDVDENAKKFKSDNVSDDQKNVKPECKDIAENSSNSETAETVASCQADGK